MHPALLLDAADALLPTGGTLWERRSVVHQRHVARAALVCMFALFARGARCTQQMLVLGAGSVLS